MTGSTRGDGPWGLRDQIRRTRQSPPPGAGPIHHGGQDFVRNAGGTEREDAAQGSCTALTIAARRSNGGRGPNGGGISFQASLRVAAANLQSNDRSASTRTASVVPCPRFPVGAQRAAPGCCRFEEGFPRSDGGGMTHSIPRAIACTPRFPAAGGCAPCPVTRGRGKRSVSTSAPIWSALTPARKVMLGLFQRKSSTDSASTCLQTGVRKVKPDAAGDGRAAQRPVGTRVGSQGALRIQQARCCRLAGGIRRCAREPHPPRGPPGERRRSGGHRTVFHGWTRGYPAVPAAL